MMTSELVGVLLGLWASWFVAPVMAPLGDVRRRRSGSAAFAKAALSRATHRPRSGAAASPRGKRGRRRRLVAPVMAPLGDVRRRRSGSAAFEGRKRPGRGRRIARGLVWRRRCAGNADDVV